MIGQVSAPGKTTDALFKVTSVSVPTVLDQSDNNVNIHGSKVSILNQ